MEVRGFGYRGAMQTVSVAAPQADQNRVDIDADFDGMVRQWAVGLEQGFTISEAPRIGAGNLLTIALALSGNLHAAMESNGGLILTAEDGKHVFRYSGLSAHDAAGKALPASLDWPAESCCCELTTPGPLPCVVDPWIQLAELTASDGVMAISSAFL